MTRGDRSGERARGTVSSAGRRHESGTIQRSLDDETVSVRVVDQSGVGTARRVARAMAQAVRLSEDKTEKLALLVSEAAMNQLRHAGDGEVLLSRLRDRVASGGRPSAGVEMLAIDSGPGIVKLGRALREDGGRAAGGNSDGTSGGAPAPGTGLGIGLGSIRRLADEFAIHAPPGVGTAIMARMWTRPPRPGPEGLQVGAVSRARRGQSVCGDAWRLRRTGQHTYHLMVVDGLGHGRAAAVASRAALEGLRVAEPTTPPCDILRAAHECAAGTRGAAAMALRIRVLSGEVDVSGVGNVQGVRRSSEGWRGFTCHPGTLGLEPIRIRQSTYPIRPGEPFVVHTDGLSSRWMFRELPGLRRFHPSLLAASFYRDFGHDHDDSTVFVGRLGGRDADRFAGGTAAGK